MGIISPRKLKKSERMKKMACTLSFVLMVCCFTSPMLASEVANHDLVLTTDSDFKNDIIDWNDVISVTILFDDLSSPNCPTMEAILHDIPIVKLNVPVPRYTYFKSVLWLERSDGISLSSNPKSPFTIAKEASWQELVRYFQYHPYYTQEPNSSKYMSMYHQYVCHADLAKGLKTPWNIEPWKEDKGYWGFVNNFPNVCN